MPASYFTFFFFISIIHFTAFTAPLFFFSKWFDSEIDRDDIIQFELAKNDFNTLCKVVF